LLLRIYRFSPVPRGSVSWYFAQLGGRKSPQMETPQHSAGKPAGLSRPGRRGRHDSLRSFQLSDPVFQLQRADPVLAQSNDQVTTRSLPAIEEGRCFRHSRGGISGATFCTQSHCGTPLPREPEGKHPCDPAKANCFITL